MWYLIVSIPDLCTRNYFSSSIYDEDNLDNMKRLSSSINNKAQLPILDNMKSFSSSINDKDNPR